MQQTDTLKSGKSKLQTDSEKVENWSVHGLCSSFVADVGDGYYSSPGVYFADNVCPLGMDFLKKESGFGKGQVVLDFENSAVSMPSAERDIRKLAVFNDGSWLGLTRVCTPNSSIEAETEVKVNPVATGQIATTGMVALGYV
ncbi:hypothetical protein Tco_0742149 [Tanacetum coccineum]